MASSASSRTLVRFHVTPRFEIFYALRALAETSDRTTEWRREMEKLVPATLAKTISDVAPRPMIWALLADTLRDAPPDPTFAEIVGAIESLTDEAFPRAILGGVFRGDEIVDMLLARQRSLADAVNAEAQSGNSLVSLLGLHPYRRSNPAALTFTRIIADPASYQSDLVSVLSQFWNSAFRESWERLEPRMARLARSMQGVLESSSLPAFAEQAKLPVMFDDRRNVVASRRGSTTFPYRMLREIHVLPSAFNDTRIWGAYRDDADSVRLYLPVFDPSLLQTEHAEPDPELGFRALGDTTRYAMASFLAQSPTTSVELAKAFRVSKATISHHVQLLRAAGVLRERGTEKGVELSLDRRAVEKISTAAAAQMFSSDASRVIRRSRHQDKTSESGERKEIHKSSPGATE